MQIHIRPYIQRPAPMHPPHTVPCEVVATGAHLGPHRSGNGCGWKDPWGTHTHTRSNIPVHSNQWSGEPHILPCTVSSVQGGCKACSCGSLIWIHEDISWHYVDRIKRYENYHAHLDLVFFTPQLFFLVSRSTILFSS